MDKSERLAILDAKASDPFAKKYGASLDSELCIWINLIVSAGESQRNFERLNTLAWYIFVELQGVAFGQPARFEVPATAARFQEFIYRLNVFSTMDIPYQEWHPMVCELFTNLKRMADFGRLNFKSPECKAVEQHAVKILQRLTKDPNYDQRYTDVLNGAL